MPEQFVVPQFIDVEDKIIGPITTRQFIMGVVVMLFMFLAYRLADFFLFIVEAVLLMGFYFLVAFVKVNGRPFHYFILSVIRSIKRPSVRVWDKEATKLYTVPDREEAATTENQAPAVKAKKLVSGDELASLSLLVDTGGKYRPEAILMKGYDGNKGVVKGVKGDI